MFEESNSEIFIRWRHIFFFIPMISLNCIFRSILIFITTSRTIDLKCQEMLQGKSPLWSTLQKFILPS